jgi:hypothetical protein
MPKGHGSRGAHTPIPEAHAGDSGFRGDSPPVSGPVRNWRGIGPASPVRAATADDRSLATRTARPRARAPGAERNRCRGRPPRRERTPAIRTNELAWRRRTNVSCRAEQTQASRPDDAAPNELDGPWPRDQTNPSGPATAPIAHRRAGPPSEGESPVPNELDDGRRTNSGHEASPKRTQFDAETPGCTIVSVDRTSTTRVTGWSDPAFGPVGLRPSPSDRRRTNSTGRTPRPNEPKPPAGRRRTNPSPASGSGGTSRRRTNSTDRAERTHGPGRRVRRRARRAATATKARSRSSPAGASR